MSRLGILKKKPYKWRPKTKEHFDRVSRELSVMIMNAIIYAFEDWHRPLKESEVIDAFNRLYPNSKVAYSTFQRRIRELRQQGKITATCVDGKYYNIIPLDKEHKEKFRSLLTFFIGKRKWT